MGTNFKKLLTVALATTTFATMVGCASNQSSTSASTSETETAKKGDTVKPEIELKADSVTVETGTTYSATDNIKSVTDDVDGSLTQVKQASKGAAYYLVDDSKIDTSKAGEYSATVTAVDKAGNTATKSFKVVVKDVEKKESSKTDSKTSITAKTETKKSSEATTKTDSSKKTTTASTTTSSSNSSSSTTKTTTVEKKEHVHSWNTVHHDATGHYETVTITDKDAYTEPAYDETVSGEKYVCLGCGAEFSTLSGIDEHLTFSDTCGNYKYVDPVVVHHDAVTHPAETHTEQRWVQDSAAYDETVCSSCGAKK